MSNSKIVILECVAIRVSDTSVVWSNTTYINRSSGGTSVSKNSFNRILCDALRGFFTALRASLMKGLLNSSRPGTRSLVRSSFAEGRLEGSFRRSVLINFRIFSSNVFFFSLSKVLSSIFEISPSTLRTRVKH